MITIRTIENIKLGALITKINGLYAILLGIAYIAFFEIMMQGIFKTIGDSWGFFDRYNPIISFLIHKQVILIGLLVIAMGICIVYLSSDISRRKEKMPWIVLFVVGIIFWSSFLTIEIFNKNWYAAIPAAIGWFSFIVGMLIPIKYYIEKPDAVY